MRIKPLADHVVLKNVEVEVTVGQKVIYQKYAGTEVKIEKQEYTIVRQSDILAILED